MEDYWETIERTLRAFWAPEDELRCVSIYSQTNSRCELCGHYPITNNYVLENSRTKRHLTVGSNCVHQFKVVVEKLSQSVRIVFPPSYAKLATEINTRYPNTVEVHDFDRDAENVVSERLSDAEDWARSKEEGWYYSDEDEDEHIDPKAEEESTGEEA